MVFFNVVSLSLFSLRLLGGLGFLQACYAVLVHFKVVRYSWFDSMFLGGLCFLQGRWAISFFFKVARRSWFSPRLSRGLGVSWSLLDRLVFLHKVVGKSWFLSGC